MPETVLNCNLCGSTELVAQPQLARLLVDLPAQLGITKCRKCDLIFMSPRLTVQENSDFYNFSEVYSVEEYCKRVILRTDFFARRISQLQMVCARPGRLLEIGAATGHFLKLARDVGWEVEGVDISQPFSDYAAKEFGITVRVAKTISECCFPASSFDVVYSAHVFEHLSDPMATFREVARILKPGGVLLVEVPHQFTSLREICRKWLMTATGEAGHGRVYSKPISTIHHLFFFTPRTLALMAKKSGLEVSKVRTYESHHDQIIGDAPLGGYWLAEMMHRAGAVVGRGPVVVLWARHDSAR